jgi:hypothetical protein
MLWILFKRLKTYLPAYQDAKPMYCTLGMWTIGVVFLFCIECFLRATWVIPGRLYSDFKGVDSLIEERRFVADDRGMTTFDPRAHLGDGPLYHVNEQGFLSSYNYDSLTVDSLCRLGKKRVLLVGDSFLEGVIPSGDRNGTFIELTRKHLQEEYALFPCGVGTTDPVNYRLVCEKYLPIIQPDLVVVVFFAGNDILEYDRKPTPFIPSYYVTNAGWLQSVAPPVLTKQGEIVFKSSREAYTYYQGIADLERGGNLLRRLMGKLAITTAIYQVGWCLGHIPTQNYYNTYKQLDAIEGVCQKNHTPLQIVVIPDKSSCEDLVTQQKGKEKYGDVFLQLLSKTHFATGFTQKEYTPQDGHFNEQGNAHFATILERVIVAKKDQYAHK